MNDIRSSKQVMPKRLETLSFEPGILSVKLSGYGKQNYDAELIFDYESVGHMPNEEGGGSYVSINIPHSELIAIRDFLNRILPLSPIDDAEWGCAK